MVPMLSPDGRSGDIPQERIQDALAAGFKQVVPMVAPDGKTTGYIPTERVQDARTAGFKPQVNPKIISNLTANPKGEGTYAVSASDGRVLQVPYSSVPVAQGLTGFTLSQADNARYEKDAAADPHRPSFWNSLTNPVGSGEREQGFGFPGKVTSGGLAELPGRVLGEVIPGGAAQVGGQAIKAMVQPVLHPVDTVTGGLKTAAYADGHAMGVPMPEEWNPVTPIVQKYMSDQQEGGNALALENLGGQALGTVEGGRMGGAAVSKAIQPVADMAAGAAGRLAPKLYESALKPSTTLGMAERANITQTALQHKIPVSQEGLRNLGDLIGDLNQNIKDVIAADPTRPIDPNAVATRVDQIAPRMASQVNAGDDLAAIEASKQQFLREQGARPGQPAAPPQPTGVLDARGNPVMTPGTPATPPQPAPPMAAADAQAMKQGTYRALGDKNYGELKGATVEAQKALARGLKEEIANQFPELDSLNRDESRLLDLQPVLERAINRISNHQLIGIGTPIAGAAAGAVSRSGLIGGITAFMKSIVDDPMVKSRLAIQLSKASKIPPADAFQKVAAYSSSLGAAGGVAAGDGAPADRTGPNGQPNFYSEEFLRSKAAFDAQRAAGKSKETP